MCVLITVVMIVSDMGFLCRCTDACQQLQKKFGLPFLGKLLFVFKLKIREVRFKANRNESGIPFCAFVRIFRRWRACNSNLILSIKETPRSRGGVAKFSGGTKKPGAENRFKAGFFLKILIFS